MTHVAKAVLLVACLLAAPAHAWNRGPATRFATLPPGTAHPEGLAIDAAGNVYVADLDVSKTAGPGQVVVFDPTGKVLRVVEPTGSSNLLLGLDFHRVGRTTELLVVDFGAKNVLRVDPVSGAAPVFTTIPGGAAAGPNALTFDAEGNVYVSDSFQGVIWKTGPAGGAAEPWATSPLLATTGVPPFGANGIAFDRDGAAMFVANTGNDTVVRIPVVAGEAGTPEVLVNSIDGADGLAVDPDGNVWVCANQADELVVVDPTDGHALAKLGDFDGISPDGAPAGLLFPASLAFRGEFVYVTNLALDLRLFNPAFNAVDSAWTAQVTRHTVARLPLRHLR
jgi:sugar lactone lactonase YvrE